MACDLTRGRIEDCKSFVGGIDAIYFVDFGGLGTVTTGSSDEITDLDGTFSAYKYEVKSTATTMEQTINSSRDNGTTFISQVVNITLKGLSKEDNKELKLMAWGRPHIIVEDRNGNSFMVGLERGSEITGGTAVTGGAMGDLSGYTLNFTAEEKTFANVIDGAVAGDPFAGLTSATATIVTS